MHVKILTLKRYKGADCKFVNSAFVIVWVDEKSSGIDQSVGTQCIVSCWSC